MRTLCGTILAAVAFGAVGAADAGDLLPAADGRAKAVASFGATEKVALKTGWRFVKGDDPAAGTNLTIKEGEGSELIDTALLIQ